MDTLSIAVPGSHGRRSSGGVNISLMTDRSWSGGVWSCRPSSVSSQCDEAVWTNDCGDKREISVCDQRVQCSAGSNSTDWPGETGRCHQYARAAPALLFSSGALQFLLPAALRVIQFGLVPQQEFLFWVSRSFSFSLFFFASPGCLSGVLSLSFWV